MLLAEGLPGARGCTSKVAYCLPMHLQDFDLRRRLSDDMERPMPLKEDCYLLIFPRRGHAIPHWATGVGQGLELVWSGAGAGGQPGPQASLGFLHKRQGRQGKQLRTG